GRGMSGGAGLGSLKGGGSRAYAQCRPENCRQNWKYPRRLWRRALGRRARGRIEQRVYRVGQFDARSERAGPSPTSEMKPRVALPSASTSMASSEDDCHDPFTSVAASAGNEIAAPGGITVASR